MDLLGRHIKVDLLYTRCGYIDSRILHSWQTEISGRHGGWYFLLFAERRVNDLYFRHLEKFSQAYFNLSQRTALAYIYIESLPLFYLYGI